jgi:hypothetical protein
MEAVHRLSKYGRTGCLNGLQGKIAWLRFVAGAAQSLVDRDNQTFGRPKR